MARNPVPKVCESCGKDFLALPYQVGRYCSNACRPKSPKVPVQCFRCGKTMMRWPSTVGRGIDGRDFCSAVCRDTCHATERKKRGPIGKREVHFRKCLHCQTTFHHRNKAKKFCSMQCRKDNAFASFVCTVCDKTFLRKRYRGKRLCCSNECLRDLMSYANSGANHPGWKGGCYVYYGAGWPKYRLACLNRDQHTCRICNRTKAQLPPRCLQVHHVVPYRLTQNHSLTNLITLCIQCHVAIEHAKIPCPIP